MNRIGSRENLIRELMITLGQRIQPSRIYEAIRLLQDIQSYDFKTEVPVYFYHDIFIDDDICLTEKKDEVDWEAKTIVEIQQDKNGIFWAKVFCN